MGGSGWHPCEVTKVNDDGTYMVHCQNEGQKSMDLVDLRRPEATWQTPFAEEEFEAYKRKPMRSNGNVHPKRRALLLSSTASDIKSSTAKDCERMADFLEARNFAKSEILWMNQPGKASENLATGVKNHLYDMRDESEPEDSLVLYISSHGSQKMEVNNGFFGSIFPSFFKVADYSLIHFGEENDLGAESLITSWWLTEYAKSIPKDRNLLVILNVCFAAHKLEELPFVYFIGDAESGTSKWRDNNKPGKTWKGNGGNVIFIASCGRDECSTVRYLTRTTINVFGVRRDIHEAILFLTNALKSSNSGKPITEFIGDVRQHVARNVGKYSNFKRKVIALNKQLPSNKQIRPTMTPQLFTNIENPGNLSLDDILSGKNLSS